MLKNFSLADNLDWAAVDAEDGARRLRKIFEDIAFENENLSLDGEQPISALCDSEMERLHHAEVSLRQAAQRISEIKTTLATLIK